MFKPSRLLSFLLVFGPQLAAAQEHPIVLKAATILDGNGHILHNTAILVEGEKIARIGGSIPRDAVVYDLSGLTVTPGFIDAHAHIWWHFDHGRLAGKDEPPVQGMLHAVDNATLTLRAGFTTIQSPGSPEDRDLREAIARGIIPGPRILTSLEPLTETSGPPEKLRELVRQRKQEGADFIKLFASKSIREGGAQTMTDAQLQAACGEAKSLGLRTIVHAHSAESAKAAILAGCTAIEHGAYVTDEVFDLMAQHGTYYDPISAWCCKIISPTKKNLWASAITTNRALPLWRRELASSSIHSRRP
jgi:imidazolonepropionase-like amidohydrolase